ncbi:MAG: hypothetical protein AAGE43_19120 [Pseudomonadota bacterium]
MTIFYPLTLRRPALLPILVALVTMTALLAMPGAAPLAAEIDTRSRIVESNLRDLSRSNDAAITSNRLQARPSSDALGNPRLDLTPRPRPDSSTLVRSDVQSSLHRLRRETASAREPDDRKARVRENATDPGR